jgi:hypothetical protein
MTEEIKNTIKKLDSELKSLTNIEADLQKEKTIYDEKIKNLIESKTAITDTITKLKEEINVEALKEFKETKNKAYCAGIGIQERKSITYDSAKAFTFAKEKQMFLKLDEKAFEKAATSLGLDWVKEEKVLLVTYPKELKLED